MKPVHKQSNSTRTTWMNRKMMMVPAANTIQGVINYVLTVPQQVAGVILPLCGILRALSALQTWLLYTRSCRMIQDSIDTGSSYVALLSTIISMKTTLKYGMYSFIFSFFVSSIAKSSILHLIYFLILRIHRNILTQPSSSNNHERATTDRFF